MYNLFDSHTHSDNSFDGEHSITFLCEQAVQRGMLGIAITDHCDVDMESESQFVQRLVQSNFEVRKARVAFGKGFSISSGVEMGEPDADYGLAERVLARTKFDFVIGSIHTVGDKRDPYFMDFARNDDPYAILELYFKRMLLLVQWDKYDVLGHITYPMRYIVRDGRDDVSLERYEDLIDEILRGAAQHGRGMEINTSDLQRPPAVSAPILRYVRRFRELGGEIITIGSDAHRAEQVGSHIEEGMELACAAGFRYFSFFKNREPRMMPLL